MKRSEMPLWQRKILDEVEKNCESIREVDAGILVTPKRDANGIPALRLYHQLTRAGATYNWSVRQETYLIPTEHVIKQHLDGLRLVFGTSQSEIRERMRFLVNAGVSVERIRNEMGASRATVYRYTKQKKQSMENET